MLLFEQSRVPNNHRKNNSCTNDVFRSQMVYESRHEAQSKGKLWLSGGRKVYSCSDLHTAMCRGVDDYGNKQKIVAKDAYQQAPSTGGGNKGSKMVRNGEEE